MTDHSDMEGLLGAYALSALDEHESVEVARHLPTCPTCSRKLAEMRLVAAALPAAVEAHDPPPQLKARVLAAIHEERGRGIRQAAAPLTMSEDDRPAPAPHRNGRPAAHVSAPLWKRLFSRPLAPAAIAVAALAAVGGLALWGMQLQSRLDQTEDHLASTYDALAVMAQADEKLVLAGTSDASNARGVLAYSSGRQLSSMIVWGIPIDPDRSYVAWKVSGGVPVKLGGMEAVDKGVWIMVPGDIRGVEAVGITVGDASPGSPGTILLKPSASGPW